MSFVGTVGKLGHALTWPLVALIVFPFVLWRIGKFASAITSLHALASDEKKIGSLVQDFEGLASHVENLKNVQEELRFTRLALQAAKIEAESVQEQTEALKELTPLRENGDVPDVAPANIQRTISEYWTEVEALLKEKFESANITSDFRSPRRIGDALAQLVERDGRQHRQLKMSDAELAVALAVGIKSIRKNGAWLTQEYANQFYIAAEGLKSRLKNWKPRSANLNSSSFGA